jgi:hypothetical protein
LTSWQVADSRVRNGTTTNSGPDSVSEKDIKTSLNLGTKFQVYEYQILGGVGVVQISFVKT